MQETPFAFAWPVDQDGYRIIYEEEEMVADPGEPEPVAGSHVVARRGGALRLYHPLDDETLWLRFAQDCKDAASVLRFANEYGRLGRSSNGPDHRLDHILQSAEVLRGIWKHIQAGDRIAATLLFLKNGPPTLKQIIVWDPDRPERFHYKLLPLSLRDALFYQAGEAITGKRRFGRCRNEGCSNWFRLGAHIPDNGRAHTITARREFCSDRCRVASARRKKTGASAHA
jgi:hypothetical protein